MSSNNQAAKKSSGKRAASKSAKMPFSKEEMIEIKQLVESKADFKEIDEKLNREYVERADGRREQKYNSYIKRVTFDQLHNHKPSTINANKIYGGEEQVEVKYLKENTNKTWAEIDKILNSEIVFGTPNSRQQKYFAISKLSYEEMLNYEYVHNKARDDFINVGPDEKKFIKSIVEQQIRMQDGEEEVDHDDDEEDDYDDEEDDKYCGYDLKFVDWDKIRDETNEKFNNNRTSKNLRSYYRRHLKDKDEEDLDYGLNQWSTENKDTLILAAEQYRIYGGKRADLIEIQKRFFPAVRPDVLSHYLDKLTRRGYKPTIDEIPSGKQSNLTAKFRQSTVSKQCTKDIERLIESNIYYKDVAAQLELTPSFVKETYHQLKCVDVNQITCPFLNCLVRRLPERMPDHIKEHENSTIPLSSIVVEVIDLLIENNMQMDPAIEEQAEMILKKIDRDAAVEDEKVCSAYYIFQKFDASKSNPTSDLKRFLAECFFNRIAYFGQTVAFEERIIEHFIETSFEEGLIGGEMRLKHQVMNSYEFGAIELKSDLSNLLSRAWEHFGLNSGLRNLVNVHRTFSELFEVKQSDLVSKYVLMQLFIKFYNGQVQYVDHKEIKNACLPLIELARQINIDTREKITKFLADPFQRSLATILRSKVEKNNSDSNDENVNLNNCDRSPKKPTTKAD